MTRPKMSDDEVVSELRSNSAYNQARLKFSSACGRIEQAGQQRKPLTPIEIRRMEFEAVDTILDALGLSRP